MKPSVGRIVHLNDVADCTAAIITAVYDDGVVSLTVFPAGDLPFTVDESEEGIVVGQWHWPERVEVQ